jgi:hypothetical protein
MEVLHISLQRINNLILQFRVSLADNRLLLITTLLSAELLLPDRDLSGVNPVSMPTKYSTASPKVRAP